MKRIDVVVGKDAAGIEPGYWAGIKGGDPDFLQMAYQLQEPFPRCAIRLGTLRGIEDAEEYARRLLASAGIPKGCVSVTAFIR